MGVNEWGGPAPIYIPFLLAALFSARARVIVDDTGITATSVTGRKVHPRPEIAEVRTVKTEYYSDSIRTGTDRCVDVSVGGKWRDLPVPKAGCSSAATNKSGRPGSFTRPGRATGVRGRAGSARR